MVRLSAVVWVGEGEEVKEEEVEGEVSWRRALGEEWVSRTLSWWGNDSHLIRVGAFSVKVYIGFLS